MNRRSTCDAPSTTWRSTSGGPRRGRPEGWGRTRRLGRRGHPAEAAASERSLVMTRTIEDLLAASMREEVVGLTPAPDLVARAAKRHRQRTRVRLAAAVTGTAGIAAAVAIGL